MRVNLLPQELQKKPFYQRTNLLIALLLLCAIIPALWYIHNVYTQLAELASMRDALSASVNRLSGIDALLRERDMLENELRRLEGETSYVQPPFLAYIDEMVRLMPDSIYITSLSLDRSSLYLQGLTPTYKAAAEFLEVLAGSDFFELPSLSFLNSDTGGHRFEIRVSLKVVTP